MEEELVASNEYNEIEVAKYGKRKNKLNKNKGKNKFLIATSFIINFNYLLIYSHKYFDFIKGISITKE